MVMATDLPTFSEIERVIHCPLSHVLPHSNESGEYAEAGRAVHTYLQAVTAQMGIDPLSALEHVPEEHRATCEAIPLDALPKDLAAEVPLAYDVYSGEGRQLPAGEGFRCYESARPTEIVGTVDALGVRGLQPIVGGPWRVDSCYIGDYKTGRPCTPARENPQLLAAALAATRAFNCDQAELELIYVWHGDVWKDSAIVDTFDLLAWEDKLRAMVLEIRATTLSARAQPGKWCRYCPAFSACPEQGRLAHAMTDGSLALQVEEWCGIIGPDDAPILYEKWQQMKMLTERVGNILKAWSKEHGPIPIGDGRAFGPVQTAGNEKLDGPVVAQVVAELYGVERALACVVPTATKASIHRGLDGVGDEKLVLGRVRQRGGASRTPSVKIKEHRNE